jgi:DNA repair exonuclease SbcCD ATPase subunit
VGFDSAGLKEGAEVAFLTGGRGFLVEKSKGGWWRVAVNQTDGGTTDPLIVKVRASSFRLVEDAKTKEPQQTTTDPVATSALSPIEAALSGLLEQDESFSRPAPYVLPFLEAPARHAATNKWVIFSDLHVKGSSIECCIEVLDKVHDAAVQRNAGVIFLGDFWHVRGALNVELLNTVLRSFRQWTQPVIMIPGNHDQVTLGGAVHALEPLVYAFHPDQVLLISEPTVCLGALWVPYRRDPALMKSILAAGRDNPDVGIIFCHADVRGAYMNDGMRSREGIEMSFFPSGVPIYSGHFHKPHTMTKSGASLRYVGSPYQTSLSEAGQDKFLYTMSCVPSAAGQGESRLEWKEDERWVLDVGKKYFKASSVRDPVVIKARRGDRVVLPVRVGEDAQAESLLVELKGRGVEVELRRERVVLGGASGKAGVGGLASPVASSSLLQGAGVEAEAGLVPGVDSVPAPLDPLSIFSDFMGSGYAKEALEGDAGAGPSKVGANTMASAGAGTVEEDEAARKAAKEALHQAVVQEGRDTLLRIMNTEAGASAGARIAGGKVCDLRLEDVVLSNFGPFGGDKVRYPLSSRGLVLIRGQSTDGTGADSNGAGKTTLAMSVMWGLTGSMDARLVADGKAVDVAYDAGSSSSKRTAEVAIRGKINDKPFEVTRKRGARRADLAFVLDGKELTTLAVKDTQALIDETLGIGSGLLQRCCFFGQHSHTLQSLLGLTDVRLKSELSCLVDTELWTLAAADVRGRERADRARVTELTVEARVRQEELTRTASVVAEAATGVRQLEAQLERAKAAALAEMGRTRDLIVERFGNATAGQLSEDIEANRRAADVFRQTALEPLRASVVEGMRRHGATTAALDQANSTLRERISQFRAAALASGSSLSTLQNKTRQLDLQARGLEMSLRNLTAQFASVVAAHKQRLPTSLVEAWGKSEQDAGAVDVEATRVAHEAALLALADLSVRIEAAEQSLLNLRAAIGATGEEEGAGSVCAKHEAEQCPTCGQALPAALRQAREADLVKELASLKAQHETQVRFADDLRGAVDTALRVAQSLEQLTALGERRAELAAETDVVEAVKRAKDEETAKLERELALKTIERADVEREWRRAEGDKERELAVSEQQLAALVDVEASLRRTLEELRVLETRSTSSQGQANATVLLLEDRVKQAREAAAAKAGVLYELEDAMRGIRAQEREIAARSLVLERLAEVLGPRGVQHYVFISVLKQLEAIANSYLLVLAEGGMQLTLQGDDDADKIVKAVWVRSADGTMRERGLSQLSGGQWRRVSMALDLAFAEIIRRRGTLRSNLIVMDEVLTHLDASGREAVGSVLRAMVDGPRAGEALPDVLEEGQEEEQGDGAAAAFKKEAMSQELSRALLGGGAYETAIVILQDLAAMELEEAFDHVDVVVKAADTSKVIIDGNEEGKRQKYL